MTEHDVAIVGAGPAGVSVALSLRDRGLRPLLIDRADQVASSWRSRYDRLKLNTGRQFSHLPNRPYPKGTPMFPTRDDVVAHLDRHAGEDGIELRLGHRGAAHRARTRRLARPHLHGRRRRAASRRSDRLPERRARPAIPGRGRVHRQTAALVGIPQPRPVSGQKGVGGRLGVVGNGARARPCDRRGGQGLVGSAHATEHPAARHFPAGCPAISLAYRSTAYRSGSGGSRWPGRAP